MILWKINEGLGQDIEEKLQRAQDAKDGSMIKKMGKVKEQRMQIYGVHWKNDGTPREEFLKESYPNLVFEFVN